MNTEKRFDTAASVFGLIMETQFDRTELHGFEVDLNGKVIVPEFRPRRVSTGALPALMAFTSKLLIAAETAA